MVLLRAIILASLIVSSGCIYVPTFDDQPPPNEFTEPLQVGHSSKEYVISLLGEPSVSRDSGSIAIYDNSKISGHIVAFLPPGIGGWYSFKDFASTLIEFDGNLTTFIGSLNDGYGCYENDVCLDSGWTTYGGLRLVRELTALSTTGVDDQIAKAFRPPENGCNIYLYAVGNIRADYPILASIGDQELVPMSQGNYLRLNVPYNTQKLEVFHSGTAFLQNGEKELLAEADITCLQTSVDFIEITYRFGESGPNTRSAKITLVGIEKGRNEILQRRLLILP